jgi:formylglycine-generating enzyme required for sulfatase activity
MSDEPKKRSWVWIVIAAFLLCPLLERPASCVIGDDVRASPFVGAKAGQLRDDNCLKMKLVWCPAGQFVMGSPPTEEGRLWDEAEVPVSLTRGIWLGQYELTQGEWQRIMKTTPWSRKKWVEAGADYPATYVDRDDAMRFCTKLTEVEYRSGRLPVGCKYTLPSEAEWEYACRAGTKTRFSFGDDQTKLREYAWYSGATPDDFPQKVGLKKPNPWGLYDIHGNVREWCRDGYLTDKNGYPLRKGGNDPELPPLDANGVSRGGSYDGFPANCRSAARGGVGPGFHDGPAPPSRFFNLGFRVALESVGK